MKRIAFIAIITASSASANPVDMNGFGGRAAAMGGAQTAATLDGGANYYNPAALASFADIQIDLGYQFSQPFLSINGGDQDVDQSRGFIAALTAPGKLAGINLALGAALFLPDERVARARALPGQRPRWSSYDNRPQRLFLGSHLAVRLARGLYLGAGVAYMSRSEGYINLDGRVGFPDSTDSDLALTIDFRLKSIRYPQAGILWQARPWLNLGLTYRGQFVAQFDQFVRISGDVGSEGSEPIVEDGYFELDSLTYDLFQPAQLAAGLAARLSPRLLIAADVTWYQWSKYANPSARIGLELDLKDWQDLVKLPDPLPLPALHFHDTIVPRVGIEYRLSQGAHTTWNLRGGYVYEPTSAPEQSGETNFVDNDKHTFSAGIGVSISRITSILLRPFDIDVHFAGTFLPERSHHKLSPTDAVGDYVSEGFVYASGLTTRWHF